MDSGTKELFHHILFNLVAEKHSFPLPRFRYIEQADKRGPRNIWTSGITQPKSSTTSVSPISLDNFASDSDDYLYFLLNLEALLSVRTAPTVASSRRNIRSSARSLEVSSAPENSVQTPSLLSRNFSDIEKLK